MSRIAASVVLLALAVLPRVAQADGGGAYRLLIAGTSEGEPSTPKQVTTFTLYGASLLSLGAGTYFLVDWQRQGQERDDFNRTETQPCADFASSACARASALDSDVNRSLGLGFGGLATGVTLAVSGVFVAQYWPNLELEPSLAFLPGGGFAGARLRF